MGAKENTECTITLLHFNDSYNIEPQKTEPVGGAARFKTVLTSFESLEPLVLFSGDILSPSSMSTFTKGEQMIPVLNSFATACAVYGNHEFDFGIENLIDFKDKCNFPWLMSNVLDTRTNSLLAEGLEHVILERKGKKIGLIGLVEEEWISTLAYIDAEDVEFRDYVDEGRRLAQILKSPKFDCDYVIALTHMRFPNDCRLAENVAEIDLILGGHDHVYEVRNLAGKYLVKSGSDFRQLSKIQLKFKTDDTVDVTIERINVTSDFEEDPELTQQLSKYDNIIGGQMDSVLGHFSIELDGKFSSTRTRETNLGNFVADIVRATTRADIAILNSGTLRSDRIHEPGAFTIHDFISVLPTFDPLVVFELSGLQVLAALENGVSQYPNLEGRFPQVSGISFAFNPKNPPVRRIQPEHVKVGEHIIDLEKKYSVVSKVFIYSGRDGYGVVKNAPIIVEPDSLPSLRTAVECYLSTAQKRNQSEKHHRSFPVDSPRNVNVNRRGPETLSENEPLMFSPVVDGRIIILTSEWYAENSHLLNQSSSCPVLTAKDFR